MKNNNQFRNVKFKINQRINDSFRSFSSQSFFAKDAKGSYSILD